ncbi:MAG: molecular chaperone DnaJ [Proteobacteria bacterium]|nr:molecular chaperone DnaJ [Pseudomonadota bacterium]
MTSRASLPSDFESIIDDLFGLDDRPAGAPRPNRLSIDSLEAAWALAAASRGVIQDYQVPPKHPYAIEEHGAFEAEPLLDPNKILLELGLDANFSEADITTLRREFALRNHPDRVQSDLRELATQRMMIANDLMDRYVARLKKSER